MARKKDRTQKAFELVVSTDQEKARQRLKKYGADLKKLNKAEKAFVRQAQKRAAAVRAAQVPAPGTTTVASRAQSRFRASRSSKNIAFGAEGVRISHLRFNQAGRFSFSERTFLRSSAFLGAAVAGQIGGNVLQAAVRIRDEIRQGVDPLSVVGKYIGDNIGRTLKMAGQLFGITNIATAIYALRSGDTWEQAEKGMADLGVLLLGSEDAVLKRMHEIASEEAATYVKHRQAQLKSMRRVRARNLQRWPQDVQSQTEAIREDLAVEEGDSRLMVRDITNVPLWKRVGLSINSGS